MLATASFLAYQMWIWCFDRLSARDRRAIGAHIARRPELPTLHVVIAVDRASEQRVHATLRGLRQQLYPNWRATVILDAACGITAADAVRQAADPRIEIARDPDAGSPAAAWTVAVAVGVLLRPHALYLIALAAAEHPDATLIYGDEDRIGPAGLRRDPYFKAGYSPELARATDYLGPCVAIRGAAAELPAYRSGDAMTWLRSVTTARAPGGAVRIPFVLYHDALAPRPQPDPPPAPAIPDSALPAVTIIVPTKDRLDLIRPCLDSLLALTDYPPERRELVVVDNGSSDPATLAYLSATESTGAARLIRDPRPFNFSLINNDAAATASGDLLVFLNNDTQIVNGAWLRRLVGYAIRDDIGAVGLKLIYPNRRVQHIGIVLCGSTGGDAHVGIATDAPGYRGLAQQTHEVAAVTGACLAVRTALFREIGGFDTEFPGNYSDVILCLDLLARGYRNLVVADVEMIHHESQTRRFFHSNRRLSQAHKAASGLAVARYPDLFRDDPFYNPNLSWWRPYSLAFPPRVTKPWRKSRR